jgi:hypothetical protein
MDGVSATDGAVSAVDELKALQEMAMHQPIASLPTVEQATDNPENITDESHAPIESSTIVSGPLLDNSLIITAEEILQPDPAINSQPLGITTWPMDHDLLSSSNLIELSNPIITTTGPMIEDPLSVIGQPSHALDIDIPSAAPAEILLPAQPDILLQATVSPSDITRSIETEETTVPPLLVDQVETEGTNQSELDDRASNALPSMGSQDGFSPGDVPSAAVIPIEVLPNEFIISVPFAANVRPVYNHTIVNYRKQIEAFTNILSSDSYMVPDRSLVAEIDQLFSRLLDLCDYPTFDDSLPFDTMSAVEIKKHAVGTNGKFSFVAELLDNLRQVDKRILIIARSQRLLGYLEAIIGTEGIPYSRSGLNDMKPGNYQFPLQAVLVGTDQDLHDSAFDFDIIVAFDYAFTSTPVYQELSNPSTEGKPPILLTLVASLSIEHIDLRISSQIDPLERKSALLISVVQARSLVAEPERGSAEPHVQAFVISEHIKEPTDDFEWEPQPIPDEIFDVYLSSQVRTSPHANEEAGDSNSRKRRMVGLRCSISL